MAGNKVGGAKAAATIKKKYGEDFYKRAGRKGGKNGTTGGFASSHSLAKRAGRKGGKASRRSISKQFEMNGKVLTAKEWAEKLDLCVSTIYSYGRTGKMKVIEQ